MNYSFHPEAEIEFFEAIDCYEDCGEGLGLEFSREIFAAIKRIVNFPQYDLGGHEFCIGN